MYIKALATCFEMGWYILGALAMFFLNTDLKDSLYLNKDYDTMTMVIEDHGYMMQN